MKKTLLAILALALVGCFPKDEDEDDSYAIRETGDNDTDGNTNDIVTVTYSYDSYSWSYKVELIGWAELVTLFITQDTASPWEEEHELRQGDYDPYGSWDEWYIDLEIDYGWDDWVGYYTLYPGTPEMEATMAWRMESWDAGMVEDCVVWSGEDADVAIIMEDGCREIEPMLGEPPAPHPEVQDVEGDPPAPADTSHRAEDPTPSGYPNAQDCRLATASVQSADRRPA